MDGKHHEAAQLHRLQSQQGLYAQPNPDALFAFYLYTKIYWMEDKFYFLLMELAWLIFFQH